MTGYGELEPQTPELVRPYVITKGRGAHAENAEVVPRDKLAEDQT